MATLNDQYTKFNLLQLQNDLSEIVFDYIDTSQKWDIAYQKLDELLNKTIGHFQSSEQKEEIKSLTENTFWFLFLNNVSRLIYFHTLAYKEMKAKTSEFSKETVLSLVQHAVKCLPNTKHEENKQFIEEVKVTVKQLGGSIDEIEKIVQKNNQDPMISIVAFREYCKLYG